MASVTTRVNFRILEKFSFLAAARIFLEILQAVFLIYLARKSTLAYGNLMLAMGVGIILCIFADFGLNQLLVLSLNGKEEQKSAILTNITMVKGSLFVLGWLGAVGFVYWQGYDSVLKLAVLVVGIGFGIEALANTFFVVLQVNDRQDMEAGIRAVGALLGFGFGIIALLLDASLWVVSFFKVIEGLTCCVPAILVAIRVAPFGFGPLRLAGWVKTVQATAVFAFITIAQILNDKLNLLFLKQYGGSWEVAQYSAPWQLVEGVAMLVVGLMLRSVLFPVFARLWKNDNTEAARVAQYALAWLLLVSIPVMLFLYVESDRIILLVYGPEYGDSIWIQRCLVGTICMCFIQFLVAYMMISMGKAGLLLVFYALVLVVNVIWCISVIPKAPMMGAVGAIILSKMLIAAMGLIYCQARVCILHIRSSVYLLTASVLCVSLFVICSYFLVREIAGVIALLPILALAWRLKKVGLQTSGPFEKVFS
jgi:O-antigen/teichoic acid export membrane protein